MRELGLEPQAVAAAAGLSASTLYRLMKGGRSRTKDPRLRTKRGLARALRTTVADLFHEPQLELLANPPLRPVERASLSRVAEDTSKVRDFFERLVLRHYQAIDVSTRPEAARAAAIELVDVFLAFGSDPAMDQTGDLQAMSGGDRFEELLLMLFPRLPRRARRYSAGVIIRAMLRVQWVANGEPSAPLYRYISQTTWVMGRLRRDRPIRKYRYRTFSSVG